ncbi:hypothetical protein [Hwangdonia sp.]|uniref:hypothetical protein n=1 Tax=Hwangdonia sp. TaxID=1883432 RepID=UPI003AB48389
MDKLSIVYAVLGGVFALLFTLRQMKVSSDKDLEDDNFNTSSERFFREHNFDKVKYRNFFKYGYTVYHHSLQFDKPFKKSYGNELIIEFSDVKILEPTANRNFHVFEVKTNFKNFSNGMSFVDSVMGNGVDISIDNVNKVQMLREIAFGHQGTKMVECFILLNYDKPYTYLVGSKEYSFFQKKD